MSLLLASHGPPRGLANRQQSQIANLSASIVVVTGGDTASAEYFESAKLSASDAAPAAPALGASLPNSDHPQCLFLGSSAASEVLTFGLPCDGSEHAAHAKALDLINTSVPSRDGSYAERRLCLFIPGKESFVNPFRFI